MFITDINILVINNLVCMHYYFITLKRNDNLLIVLKFLFLEGTRYIQTSKNLFKIV